MLRTSACFAIAVLIACRSTPPRTIPTVADGAEAISLLGEPLLRPTLDAAAKTRMEAQLDQARAVAAAQPDDPDALIWVGRRTAYLGRYNDAIAVFTEGVRRFPNDARMYRHRGHRFITVRKLDAAVADFEKAATLMAGRPDEVEPDGQPNARGIPIGSLQSNVWYHLALAHYLKGHWDAAARTAQSGLAVSTNPDRLVSQTHWLYMALRRAGRITEAAAAIQPIRDDFDIIENESYYRLLKLYRRGTAAGADSAAYAAVSNASDASYAYGLANWLLYNGDTARATRAFTQIVASGQWASFGYIAAEADLARMRHQR
jgi:tetratricopeptide (TPR) repeat protein